MNAIVKLPPPADVMGDIEAMARYALANTDVMLSSPQFREIIKGLLDQIESTTFWIDCYPEGITIQGVKNEMKDYHMLLDGMDVLYEHITGGQCSIPLTSKSVVRALQDDHVDELIERAVADKVPKIDNPALPADAPESDYFILENAMQRGFEMIDDDGNVFAVGGRQLVEFVKLYLNHQPKPIDMVLYCPHCHTQHIDEADPEPSINPDGHEIMWTNPPHRSHLCGSCGFIWRPADVCTNGVAAIETKGIKDSSLAIWVGVDNLQVMEVTGTSPATDAAASYFMKDPT